MVGRELGQIRTCYYTGPALQSPELSIWVSPTSLSRANTPALSCATLVRSQVAESQKPPHPHPVPVGLLKVLSAQQLFSLLLHLFWEQTESRAPGLRETN